MRTLLAALCLLGAVACSGNSGDKAAAAADSAARDLHAERAPANALGDTAVTESVAPTTAAPVTPAPKPAAKPATKPGSRTVEQAASAPKTAAPAAGAKPAPSLVAGATLDATANDSVSSRTTKSGETMKATISADVKAADGRVVIPAGSIVTILLEQFKSAPAKGDKETFSAKVVSVEINGASQPLSGTVDHMDYTLKGRGITGGTVAKVGAGAVVGAIIGKKVTGGKGGAIVGGVAGAATGAAVANAGGDQDITIVPGAAIRISVTEAFPAK